MLYNAVFLFLCTCITNLFAVQFGYVDYSTENLGDDIQAIAAKRFLPNDCIPIERDFIGIFQHDEKLPTLVNGWFMLENSFYDPSAAFKYNWPPSDPIDPLLISLHFTPGFVSTVLTPKNKQYLLDHGPIGARDFYTLEILQKNMIPSYFSGCLTLTLENLETEKENVIYAVDLDQECVEYIKAHSIYPVEEITHSFPKEYRLDHKFRLETIEAILTKYKRARCVVTSRLHTAMPCLAYKTPVLLLNISTAQYRFSGLKELVRNSDREAFLNGNSGFDINEPGENPNTYLPIRNNLLQIIKTWIQDKQSQYD